MSTIKKIAEKAGVSPTTVSNVLHGNTARVSPAVRERVQAILQEEQYAPNMGAIILAHSNSRIIGVIMFMEPREDETALEDPFTSTILGALEREIHRNGYFMMLHATSDEAEVMMLCKTWKLDGLILLWVPGGTGRVIARSVDTPVVFVDCHFPDDGQVYHNIGLEDRTGGYELAKHLLSMGHTDIALLANAPVLSIGDRDRYEGCRQAFAERGVPLGTENLLLLPNDRHERHDLYRRLSERPHPFTALAFFADYYAAEAVSVLWDRGVRVPEDLSVIGFDDNILSRIIRPRLTTVHQDVGEKGRLAVDMIMRLIKKEPIAEPNIRLPVRLVVRDSVRDIRKG